MIRFLTILFLCTILFAPFSCSRQEQKVRIGIIVYTESNEWYQMELKFAADAARDLNFDLQKRVAPDGEKVQTALETFGAQGVKGVLICSPDVKLGPSIEATCQRLNMKLISLDDQLVDANGKFLENVPHYGIDARKIGQVVGHGLADEMKKRGWKPEDTGAMGVTYDQVETCRQRTTGASEVLQERGLPKDRIFLVARTSPPDQSAAFNAANDGLTAHPTIKNWLVFSSNDDGVLGAVRAMEARGIKAQNIIGIGVDGTMQAIGEFKKSEPSGFVGTVVLQPKLHGYEPAAAMYRWITKGEAPPKLTTTTGVLVDRTSYAAKMTELGLKAP
jgi:L-arabinose transport system substrate-binding protein